MSVIDDIRAKLDIAEVVAPYVTLQQSGRTLKANCPFHTERTPSFVVNQERQSWRCFGACATGGDMFGFVMKAENMEFGDALRTLARRAGVELSQGRDRAASNRTYSVNNAAVDYYKRVLASEAGLPGRKYLDERGVGEAARERFKIGLSANAWDGLARYLQTYGLEIEDAISAGLVRETDDGRRYDFFRNRLMFPISDRNGNVVGFGARALDNSNPKYINTAATETFDKRNTVYALHMAASAIRQSGSAVIVEGYMDAIAAHENGFANVVASMGTALTENQVSQLRSLARDFVLALDPDAAGQEATLRSLESSWRVFRGAAASRGASSQSVLSQWTPPTLKIAELPAGLDPDALIRSDPDRWREAVAGAQPLLDYVIPALVGRTDLSVPDSRAKIAAELARLINQLDEMDQYDYWNNLADALGVPLETLRASIGSRGGSGRARRRGAARPDESAEVEVSPAILSAPAGDPIEEYLLALLIRYPRLLESARAESPELFRQTENQQLFTILLACHTIDELEADLEPALAPLFQRLSLVGGEMPSMSASGRKGAQTALDECVSRLKRRNQSDLLAGILRTDALHIPPSRELQAQVQEINDSIRNLERRRQEPKSQHSYTRGLRT